MIKVSIEKLEKVKQEQKEILEKGYEYRQKELTDFHHLEIFNETEKQKK